MTPPKKFQNFQKNLKLNQNFQNYPKFCQLSQKIYDLLGLCQKSKKSPLEKNKNKKLTQYILSLPFRGGKLKIHLNYLTIKTVTISFENTFLVPCDPLPPPMCPCLGMFSKLKGLFL